MNLSPPPPPPPPFSSFSSSTPHQEQQQQAGVFNGAGITHASQGGRYQAQGSSSAPGPYQAFKSNGHRNVQQHAQTQYHGHPLGAHAGGPSPSGIPSSVHEVIQNHDNEQNLVRPRLAPRANQGLSSAPTSSTSSSLQQQQQAQINHRTPFQSPHDHQRGLAGPSSSQLNFRYDKSTGTDNQTLAPSSSSSSKHVQHNHAMLAQSQSHPTHVFGQGPLPQSETPGFPYTMTLTGQEAQLWQQHGHERAREAGGGKSSRLSADQIARTQMQGMPPPPRPSNANGTSNSGPLSLLSIAVPGSRPQYQADPNQPCAQCAHSAQTQQLQQPQQPQHVCSAAFHQQQQQPALGLAFPPQSQHRVTQVVQQIQHTFPAPPQTQSRQYTASAVPNQQLQAQVQAPAHSSRIPLPSTNPASGYIPAPYVGQPSSSASAPNPPPPVPPTPTSADPLLISMATALKPLHYGLQSVLKETSNNFAQALTKVYEDCVNLANRERLKVQEMENALVEERVAWERERRDMQVEIERLRLREERTRASNAPQVAVAGGDADIRAIQDELRRSKKENDQLKTMVGKMSQVLEALRYKNDLAFFKERDAAARERENTTILPAPTSNTTQSQSQSQSHANNNTDTNTNDINLPPPPSSSSSSATLRSDAVISRSLTPTPIPVSEPSEPAPHPQPHLHRRHSAPAPAPASSSIQAQPNLRSYVDSIVASPESRDASPAFLQRQVESIGVRAGHLGRLIARDLCDAENGGGLTPDMSTSAASEIEVIDLCSSPMSMVVDMLAREEEEEHMKCRAGGEEPSATVENTTRSRPPSPFDTPGRVPGTDDQFLQPEVEEEAAIGDASEMEMEIEDEPETDVKVKVELEVDVKLEQDDAEAQSNLTDQRDASTNADRESDHYHLGDDGSSRTLTRTRSPGLPPLLSLPTPAAGSALSPSPSPSLSRSPSPATVPTFGAHRQHLSRANPTPPLTPTVGPASSAFLSLKRPRTEYEGEEYDHGGQGPARRVKVEDRGVDRELKGNYITFSSMVASSAPQPPKSANTNSITSTQSGPGSSSSPNPRSALGSQSNSMERGVTHSPDHSLGNGPRPIDSTTPSSQHRGTPNASFSSSNIACSSNPIAPKLAPPPTRTLVSTIPNTNTNPSRGPPHPTTPVPTPTITSSRPPRLKEEGEITPTVTPASTPTPVPSSRPPSSIPAYVRPSPSKEEGEITPIPTPTPTPTPSLAAPSGWSCPPKTTGWSSSKTQSASVPVRVPVAFSGGERRRSMTASVSVNGNLGGVDEAWDVRPASTSALVSETPTSRISEEGKRNGGIAMVPTASTGVDATVGISKPPSGPPRKSATTFISNAMSTSGSGSIPTNARDEAEQRALVGSSTHRNLDTQSHAVTDVLSKPTIPSLNEVETKTAAIAIAAALVDVISHPDSEPNPVINTLLNTLPLRPPPPTDSASQNSTPRSSMDSTATATIAVSMRPPPPPTQPRHTQSQSQPQPKIPSLLKLPPPPQPSTKPPLSSNPSSTAPNSNSNTRPNQSLGMSKFNTIFRSHPHPQPTRPARNSLPNPNLLAKPQTQPLPSRGQNINATQVADVHDRQQPQQRQQQLPQQQHKLGINHMELLFTDVDGCWTCRMCQTRRQREISSASLSPTSSSTPKPIAKFSKDASWPELVGHWYKEHPETCCGLEKLTPAQVAEKKERMLRPQVPGNKANGAR